MSIRLMSAVFDNSELGPTSKLIMLALADHADDEGHCYPSIKRLCERTSLSERAVQGNIRDLQARGYLSVSMNAGRRGANIYIVRATPAVDAPRTIITPAGNAPPQEMHPAGDAPPPPQEMHPSPAGDAPEPSRTTIEPPIDGEAAKAREAKPETLTFRERILIAMGRDKSGLDANGRQAGSRIEMVEAERWITDLKLTEDDVLSVVTEITAKMTKRGDPPSSFRFFTTEMQRLAAAKAEGALQPATVAARATPTITVDPQPIRRPRAQIPEEFRD
jgi:hypothetical protein